MNKIIADPDKYYYPYIEKVLEDKNIPSKRKKIYKILFCIFPTCSVPIYNMEKRKRN